jgi:hypothetical protein
MCPDCKGTGLIETEHVYYGRPYYLDGKQYIDIAHKGDWSMTQCPCVGEDE